MDNLEARLQEHLGQSYAIQLELTGGGMSRVFVAVDVALRRKVAIKVLNPTLAATVSIERFQREIMVVAKMNHPNIVTVLSAGEIDDLPYFIMPFIDGESLRGRILRGPLSLRETVGVLKDVVRALAYAHSGGVVHRDLKPDNILLAGSAALVSDFGVAKAVSAARERGVAPGHSITGVGISLGTPQYMAPEQAAADPNADHRVDLYAMGLVAYEMLVGSPPFHGRTPQALLAAQLTELPPPLASRRYDVPVALSDLIMQCLEKDPADRPKNASDALRILDSPEAVSGPVAATPEARARRSRQRLVGAATGVFSSLAFGALVAYAFWPTPEPSQPAVTQASVGPVIRIAPVASIGAESQPMADAMSAAIEAALIRDGMRVLRGSVPPGTSDSTEATIETTVQRSGQRARALVRVSSASSSVPVWADRVDFQVEASFPAQDTVAARVVRAVRSALGRR